MVSDKVRHQSGRPQQHDQRSLACRRRRGTSCRAPDGTAYLKSLRARTAAGASDGRPYRYRVVSGILNGLQGARLARQVPGGAVPIQTGLRPAPETPPQARRIQHSLSVLGPINLLSGIGLVASTGLFWRSAVSRPPVRRAMRRRARR